jgi:L-alanine-DL-glutamate epimerase-like enolase superfamily enzyme
MNEEGRLAMTSERGEFTVKVTRVEAIPLSVPFTVPFQIASGGPRMSSEIMLVRVCTDAGLEGVGETQAWRRQGSTETLGSLKAAIDLLAPLVVGHSPFDLAKIVASMDEALYRSYYAKAPILDALYDLQGKLLGLPVHMLLGGRCRDAVGACAVLPLEKSIEESVEAAQIFYERGFRSFTVKVGVYPHLEVNLVAALRKRFDDVLIRVDANASLGFDAALALMKKLEPYQIDAAEQMIALWDLDGMADLSRRVDIPVMVDEAVSCDHDLLEVIKRRAATVVQTKVAKNGGIWHMHRLWTLARAAGMRIYPGNHPCTSIATASVVQLAAAWSGPLLDGPHAVGITGALARDVVQIPLVVENGAVTVPYGPGLGVTLDEEVVSSMRMDI